MIHDLRPIYLQLQITGKLTSGQDIWKNIKIFIFLTKKNIYLEMHKTYLPNHRYWPKEVKWIWGQVTSKLTTCQEFLKNISLKHHQIWNLHREKPVIWHTHHHHTCQNINFDHCGQGFGGLNSGQMTSKHDTSLKNNKTYNFTYISPYLQKHQLWPLQ